MSMTATYEVVSPLGQELSGQLGGAGGRAKYSPALPIADLTGKRIGLIWTAFTNGNILVEAFGDLLKKRFKDLEVVKVAPGRNVAWGNYPDPSLPELARELRIDAAIVTAGC